MRPCGERVVIDIFKAPFDERHMSFSVYPIMPPPRISARRNQANDKAPLLAFLPSLAHPGGNSAPVGRVKPNAAIAAPVLG